MLYLVTSLLAGWAVQSPLAPGAAVRTSSPQMVAELGEMVGVRSKPKIAEDITQLMHACSEKTRAPAPGWQGRLSPTDPPTAAGTRRCSSSGGRAMGSTRRSC